MAFIAGILVGGIVERRESLKWTRFHIAEFMEREQIYDMAGSDSEGRPFELHFKILPSECKPVIWFNGVVTCLPQTKEDVK
jgi:hypothetical protein